MIGKDLEQTFGRAVADARDRRHELLTLEHVLRALVDDAIGRPILAGCGVEPDALATELEEHLDDQPRVPAGRKVEVSQTIAVTRVLQRAAVHVQSSGKDEIDAGDVLAAMFREPDSTAVYLLNKRNVTRLDVLEVLSHGETRDDRQPAGGGDGGSAGRRGEPDDDPLEAFTRELVAAARDGRLDPLVGRKAELQRTMQVLCRRRKNNPVFVGESGVGKTAMAEGLAQRVADGEVPDLLEGIEIYALDLGALIAGTQYRGQFEKRLKAVLGAIVEQPNRVLFIDEIHTIVGAGATGGGTLDASAILKPMLSSGELRCIGTTTFEDYNNAFEKDRALARRFGKIEIREPSVTETVRILAGLKTRYEEHHGVTFTRPALHAAAELSHKYITDRFLPDKAIDVIDECGSMMRLEPAARRRRTVRPGDVERVISRMARVPSKTVSTTDRERLKTLDRDLRLVIYGQDPAVDALVAAIRMSRSGLGPPMRPVGSFLFSGPTGVGKTELARQLAIVLGVELIRFDMSEYMEKHTVSRLIGAPPGYVGFDQGGLLTDAVLKNPHAVLVLDEIEKAHPDLVNILLQIMDHATLTDHNGRKVDFRNVVVIMTTNAGAFLVEKGSVGFGGAGASAEDGKSAIEKTFPPEFRNRLDAWIGFDHLTPAVIAQIVDKFVAELEDQLAAKRVTVDLSEAARSWLATHGYNRRFGARPMRRLIDQAIRRKMADEILFGALRSGGEVQVDVDGEELGFTFSDPSPKGRTPTRQRAGAH